MKRLSPRHELILHSPLLLVLHQCTVLKSDLLTNSLETGLHQIRRRFGVGVMHSEFVKFTNEKPTLDGVGLRLRQGTFSCRYLQNTHCRLIPRQGNSNIQRMLGCPSYQFLRRITPLLAKRRFDHGLSPRGVVGDRKNADEKDQPVKVKSHGESFGLFPRVGKARSRARGFVLIEAMLGLSLLTVLGLVLLKLSLNILAPRQWILQQSVADAYMSYERSYAERIPFENLVADSSPWPASTALTVNSTTSSVEVGRLPRLLPDYPDGVPIMGTVTRTRFADPGNYPIDGGTGTLATNPAAMKVWKLQSVLTYKVGERTYAKSRTVLRSQ